MRKLRFSVLLVFALLFSFSFAETVTVESDLANIQKGTSATAVTTQVIAQPKKGEQVEILQEGRPWCEVKYKEVTGYATKKSLGIGVSGTLTVKFLQTKNIGEAIIITDGTESMLIDGGFASDGGNTVANLKALGITELKYLVASHGHDDHIDAQPEVINNFKILNYVCSPYIEGADSVISAAQSRGAEVKRIKEGDVLYLGDAEILCLHPGDTPSSLPEKDIRVNQDSLVLKVTYGDTVFVLCADCDRDQTTVAAKYGATLNANVVQIPHHSLFPCIAVLDTQKPQFAVTSNCHATNNKDRVLPDIISWIANKNIPFYITRNGAVTFTSDGTTVKAAQ